MLPKEKALKLYKKSRKIIITAINEEGFPTAKVVLPSRKSKSFKEVYIVTNTHSNYVQSIQKNSKACLYFYSSIIYKGCLLIGNMEICNDLSIKEQFWSKKYRNAYPEPEKTFRDPDFCVLKFEALKGRYYAWFQSEDFEL